MSHLIFCKIFSFFRCDILCRVRVIFVLFIKKMTTDGVVVILIKWELFGFNQIHNVASEVDVKVLFNQRGKLFNLGMVAFHVQHIVASQQ